MEHLKNKSKRAFCKIIDAMNGKTYLKLEVKNFLPLTIELLETGIETPLGKAKNFSFCNYYEMNGDLMQAPEMCFLVVDNRMDENSNDLDKVTILPYMLQYADIALYECSILIEHNKVVGVKEKIQYRHALLAKHWFNEIITIGYLKF